MVTAILYETRYRLSTPLSDPAFIILKNPIHEVVAVLHTLYPTRDTINCVTLNCTSLQKEC
jgi:hypothetical protein